MVGISAISAQVLLVGDMGTRLESEFAAQGLACMTAPTANDAVTHMKATRFPFVVVSPLLTDMGGVDFIHGVLRHFDASVVLYGNGVESSDINALLRTGRVAHFAANVDGRTVADFLARHAGPLTSVASFQPGAAPIPLMPAPPALALVPNGASAPMLPLISAYLLDEFPPALASSIPTTSDPRAPWVDPSLLPMSIGIDELSQEAQQRDLQQRFEAALADERARSNAVLVSMRARLGGLEQEKAALLVEVEAGRRSAMADVAWVMSLSDEGAAVHAQPEATKDKLAAALDDAARARSELVSVQSSFDSERALVEGTLASLRAALADEQEARARVESIVALERERRSQAESGLTKLRLESDAKWAAVLADERGRAAPLVQGPEILDKQRTDFALALARAEAKLRTDVAAARTEATTLRIDVQEALFHSEELNSALQSLTLERDLLSEQAGQLRERGTSLVAAHAEQQDELERLRSLLEAARSQALVTAELQHRLEATGPSGGGAALPRPEVERALDRSRQLVGAIEPLMWGLAQAIAFYQQEATPPGAVHLRSLQQLRGVLLRLRDEIAMLGEA